MKIEVWSDFVCPFCYIGKRQLEKAIQDSGYAGQIEVQFKSFLLDPTTPIDAEASVYESLSKKYNMSVVEVKNMTANIAERATEVGLNYNFEEMKTANTTAAHRLVKWAEEKGKGAELNERILKAYFLEGKAIGRADVLIALAKEVDLNEAEALQVIHSTNYEAEVGQDIYEAKQIGVRGVPFFVVNNKFGISGAQPQALFEETIEKAAHEEGLQRNIRMVGQEGAACVEGQCEFPSNKG